VELSQITPDQTIFWQWGFVKLNATIIFTWMIMGLLTVGSWLITRKLRSDPPISRWQNLFEVVVQTAGNQIRELSNREPWPYLPFIGTLFLFIAVSNILDLVPGFTSPAGSLSTTAGLAICVFFAVPIYGIVETGIGAYFKHYIRPTVFMLPFNIIGELSRTLALAIRLFGNVMSTTKIAAILLAVAPLFFPIIMNALGLLTGLIQAYIFAVLAMVYIASATRARAED
jgi:F-type H+-transporting ATPase subunit a